MKIILFDGFVWFTGVVENRSDPAKLGRVQVRCLGFHTEDLNDIPTKDLRGHMSFTQLQTHPCKVWETHYLFG